MDIVSALFIDDIALRPVPGPSTRIDLTGIQFSAPPESYPLTWTPHLCVMLRCAASDPADAALEVVFRIGDEQVARNVQPVRIDPGKFGYRLVRAEIEVSEPVTVDAECRVDAGPVLVVPFTHLPVVEPDAAPSST